MPYLWEEGFHGPPKLPVQTASCTAAVKGASVIRIMRLESRKFGGRVSDDSSWSSSYEGMRIIRRLERNVQEIFLSYRRTGYGHMVEVSNTPRVCKYHLLFLSIVDKTGPPPLRSTIFGGSAVKKRISGNLEINDLRLKLMWVYGLLQVPEDIRVMDPKLRSLYPLLTGIFLCVATRRHSCISGAGWETCVGQGSSLASSRCQDGTTLFSSVPLDVLRIKAVESLNWRKDGLFFSYSMKLLSFLYYDKL